MKRKLSVESYDRQAEDMVLLSSPNARFKAVKEFQSKTDISIYSTHSSISLPEDVG